MPSFAQINFSKVCMKNELRLLSNIYGGMKMITNAIVTH